MQRIAAPVALVQNFAHAALFGLALVGSALFGAGFAWSAPAAAQTAIGQRTVITMSWVEEWDPAQQRWVRVDETDPASRVRIEPAVPAQVPVQAVALQPGTLHSSAPTGKANRFAPQSQPPAFQGVIAQYGPFVVIDESRAAMIGSTDGASPQHFDAMVRDFPALATLEMVEAPGTSHDIANMTVGRKIRASGLSTHVPSGGSVRSGAVELFLAGVSRSIDPGAHFAVHSWLDNYGREPDDFAPDAPANRLYLDYYMEMGMSERRAREFYAMTNSVPHHSAKWLQADEMRRWIAPEGALAPMTRSAPLSAQSTQSGRTAATQQPIDGNAAYPAAPFLVYADVSGVAIAGLSNVFVQPFLDS